MERPNLFSFATKELSQDAFIAWLLSWADPRFRHNDYVLHCVAIKLIHELLRVAGEESPAAIERVEIRRQVQRIDILVRVNGCITILIEDKTHTGEHSGQLERYLVDIRTRFADDRIVPIFLKTGDQCDYRGVKESGFFVFHRRELLRVLNSPGTSSIRSDIFHDFVDWLEYREDRVSDFARVPCNDWHPDCWTGFFIELQKRLCDGAWDYVPNQSGGFMGFWWRFKPKHMSSMLYLQLEESKLCFKIEVDKDADQLVRWDIHCNALMSAADGTGLDIKRSRRTKGTWMTFALLAEDYRTADANGLLDLEGTVVTLKRAEALIDKTERDIAVLQIEAGLDMPASVSAV